MHPEMVKEIAEAAAQHIERVGWYQGGLTSRVFGPYNLPDFESPCCVYGAVRAACESKIPFNSIDSAKYVAFELLTKLHARGEVNQREGLGAWNDQPGRTKEEVLALLRGFRS